MDIRLEEPRDWRAAEELTREAFWNVYRPGCTEHYVLHRYRSDPAFIPGLDFVMEDRDGRLAGHVMFSRAELLLGDGSKFPMWTFGPIGIRPDLKRRGLGLRLLLHALDAARTLGVGALCMEGNIAFYRHAGFGLASRIGLHYHSAPPGAEVPYFLARELRPGYLAGIEGTYHPPRGYFVAEEDPAGFAAFDATFPAKTKAFRPGQLPQFCRRCGAPLRADADCGLQPGGGIDYSLCRGCSATVPVSRESPPQQQA
ncbi:MAG: N-acetyltransferase [Kiritimatiellae bacterium]|nr:N-acetyltransferase [Kiritimatiellia bacterium]